MTIEGILSLKTQEILYSRARHDFRWDSEQTCAVDGGRDYMKITGDGWVYVTVILDPKLTARDLYDDWNKRTDKLGRHKGSEVGEPGCPVVGYEIVGGKA